MRTLSIISLFTCCLHFASAQNNKILMYGFEFEASAFKYATVGVGYGYIHQSGIKKTSPLVLKTNLDIELQLSKSIISAPKISQHIIITNGNIGIIAGASYLFYTDFKNHSQVIRPQVGVDFSRYHLDVLYGYNFAIDGKSLELSYNTHQISLVFWLYRDTRKTSNCNCGRKGKLF